MFKNLNYILIFVTIALLLLWTFTRSSLFKKAKLKNNSQAPAIPTPPGISKPQAPKKGQMVKQMYKNRFPDKWAIIQRELKEYNGLSEYVFAQSMLESAQYSSNVYNNTFNPFGMGVPTKRTSIRIGEYNNFSKYDSFEQAIQDFREYLIYFNYPTSVKDITEYNNILVLKKYYTASPLTYLKGLKAFFD